MGLVSCRENNGGRDSNGYWQQVVVLGLEAKTTKLAGIQKNAKIQLKLSF